MIYSLKGEIDFKSGKFLVVDVSGVGYKVFCSPNTLKKVSENEEVKLFTSLYLREDSAELYGFLSQEELDLFEILNEISGIGPNTAMMLASIGPLEKLKEIMGKGQLPPEIKGIGSKKMQKILLELTGKISETSKKEPPPEEIINALISLGFSPKNAKEALAKIPEEIKNPEERVKEALKILGK